MSKTRIRLMQVGIALAGWFVLMLVVMAALMVIAPQLDVWMFAKQALVWPIVIAIMLVIVHFCFTAYKKLEDKLRN